MSELQPPVFPGYRFFRNINPAAWAVLLLSLLLTVLLWHLAVQAGYEQQYQQLRYDSSQVASTIEQRFSQYTTLVRSGQALFAGSQQVEYPEWRAFTDSLDLRSGYPGLRQLVFFRYLDSEQALADFIARKRAAGLAGFGVRPPGPRDYYCVLSLYGPDPVRAGELGFDACSARRPRDAFLKARTSGLVTLSAPLSLMEEGTTRVGYAIVAPIYKGKEPQSRVLLGWVGAPLPIAEVLDRVWTSDNSLSWEVRDGDTVIYRSGEVPESTSLDTGRMLVGVDVQVAGRIWDVRFARDYRVGLLPWLVLVSGVIISALLFLLLAAWSRTRAEALALAEEMTRALHESEQLLSSITNNIAEGIYRGEMGRGLVYVNPALAEMFGYESPEAMLEASGEDFYACPEQRRRLRQLLEEDGAYRNQEVEYVRRDGSTFIGINNAVAIRDEDGNVAHYDGAIYDITERKLAEERINYLAHYDALTGLPNRTLFRERLVDAAARSRKRDTRLGLLFIDLDRFKTVNDSLGHNAGDQLLCEVAERLTDCLRGGDLVSRQGGDEFIVLIDELRNTESLHEIARKIMEVISQPFQLDGHELKITPSIGITVYPDDGVDIDSLIRNADAAMYHAKESGRDNYQFFYHDMSASALARLSLESALRRALENNELELHYQPQIALADGRICGAEALLRWRHPEQGLLMPGDFIPVAEQSGLIVEIGDWVLAEACRHAAGWRDSAEREIGIAVNISALQFRRRRLVTVISDALAQSGLAAHRLELELTESVLMRHSQSTYRQLAELHAMGIRLAVDDFGTGYSSLSYLKQFRVNRLKIDQSFIDELGQNPDDEAITSAVIRMAHAMRLDVVAEGVEKEEQLDFLRQQECDVVQGFLYSRPVPADEFAGLLDTWPKPAT